jgi:DNA-binding transcriptional regulator LsrR (DeoR family)
MPAKEHNPPATFATSPAPTKHTKAFRAAEMHFIGGKSRRRIAAELNVSRATVSRLLTYARRHRLVQYVLAPRVEELLSEFLLEQLRPWGIRTVLVAAGEGRAIVGHTAARHFEDVAGPETTLILDGGLTVRDFVTALALQQRRRLTIVPIAADPPSYQVSASELITVLATKCVIHVVRRPPHLARLLQKSRPLQEKLAEVRAVAAKANFVVLGLGPWKPGFTAQDFVYDLGLSPVSLSSARNPVAAVCGYFALTTTGESVEWKKVERYMPHALEFKSLQALAAQADTHVLIVAASADKCHALSAAVRARIGNTLVLDKALALALLHCLTADAAPTP